MLRGWLYQPAAEGTFPTIIMTHGHGVHKEMGLDSYAEVFCRESFQVIAYDNRNWGESDGLPRYEVDPQMQIRDYRDAISYALTLPQTDPGKIGIWGTSLSGGHVFVVGAIDRRVACVVSMVPTISGMTKAIRVYGAEGIKAMRARFEKDRLARFRGEPPETNVQFDLDADDSLNTSLRWFKSTTKEQRVHWDNKITLRSEEFRLEYEPGAYVKYVSPTPLLIITARDDTNAYTDLALKAYENALQPKELKILDGNHFAPYGPGFEKASAAAVSWFSKYLK